MNLPNALTLSRIVVAPIFYVLLALPGWIGDGFLPCWLIAWVLFFYIEISDIVDGNLARKMGLVSDLGKVLDPFSDVVSRMTYFIAFLELGILPAWVLIILLYRELGITFLRLMLVQRGITLAARSGGKLKAVFYGISGGVGLALVGVIRLGFTDSILQVFTITFWIALGISLVLSVVSFVDYLRIALPALRKEK